ncbi:MAG: RNA polymerase sigma factor SigJ [Planctomycetota bacterium]|nr:MAG: RNA polymerase sigma factor SigJ [Planctomycetota bacterium]
MSDPTTFETHRDRLARLAYAMLGSSADAEDAVQETWIRWQRSAPQDVLEPVAWLTRVCSRVALDRLRQLRRRREEYPGTWLPEPLIDDPVDASTPAELDESVSVALLLLLERLTPTQRAAFLLHDVFGHEFDEVARMLDTSATSCRKAASRARSFLEQERPRFTPRQDEHARLLSAFHAASREGDEAALRALLSPDAVLHADAGGKARAAAIPVRGARAIARFVLRVGVLGRHDDSARRTELRRFNGAPGWLVFEGERLVTALAFDVHDGRIRALFAHRNPDKLAAFAGLSR